MINAEALKNLAVKKMNEYIDMGHFRYPDEAKPYLLDGYMQGYRQAEADAAELERCLEFYAHGGNFNTDLWKHDELGYFTGKYAKETLAKWRERGV